MQNFVGVGVADSAEDLRVGESPFERVAFAAQGRSEVREARADGFETAAVELRERCFAAHDVEARPAFRACFGENERAVLEVEREEPELLRELRSALSKVQ